MGLVIDTSALVALALGYGVLVGPGDEAHFRQVPTLRVVVFGARGRVTRTPGVEAAGGRTAGAKA